MNPQHRPRPVRASGGPVAGTVDVVVIGAGHSGLAMSACLQARGIDHVVLEKGRVANAWRTRRWDSLRLLTPNWMTRLPGHDYEGPDPDGFMNAREVADHIATAVARCAQEEGIADLVSGSMLQKRIRSTRWAPCYREYVPA